MNSESAVAISDAVETPTAADPIKTTGPWLVIEPGTTIRDAEKALVVKTLELHNGNKKEVAQILGISRSALYSKLKRFGLLG